jgi:hypothetical protein
MNPPLKTTGLFLTPRGPYGRRLPERVQNHMYASDTAVGRAFRRAGRWVKDHVFFGAEGSKSRHEKGDWSAGAGYNSNPTQPPEPSDPAEGREDFLRRRGRSGGANRFNYEHE